MSNGVQEILIVVNTDKSNTNKYEITVAPTGADVLRGQEVRWRLYTGDVARFVESGSSPLRLADPPGSFLLVFYEGNPGDKPEVRGNKEGSDSFTVGNTPGIFHYAVIASVSGKIYADVACPTLKVR